MLLEPDKKSVSKDVILKPLTFNLKPILFREARPGETKIASVSTAIKEGRQEIRCML